MAKSRFSDRGFSLVETIIAMGILATGLIALAQLFAIATNANRGARATTLSVMLAEQKMEELRALTWGYDLLGLPLSDLATNVAVVPSVSAGGTGLSPSPPKALTQNTVGYVDYLDAYGTWVGTGTTPPNGTVYIRRWSIEPVPTNPNNTLVLQVLVTRLRDRGGADAGTVTRLPEEARLISVKTRKTT